MKSKLTAIIMFFIIIIIFIAIGLIGTIFWRELRDTKELETSQKAELFKTKDTDTPSSVEKNIEVPEIRNNTNPLTELGKLNEEDKTQESNTNYENTEINKYFYNQLEDYAQTIYKAFENSKEEMKSGTYKINFGSTFTDILSQANGQKELGKYYQSAIEAFTYDNPDIFYLNPSKMFLNIETTTRGAKKTYNTYIDSGEEDNYFIDEFKSSKEVENAILKVENVKNKIVSKKTGSVYGDIKIVHDYLVENINYDKTTSKDHIYNIYGALVNNECVCEGYAKAFKYLLDAMGVDSCIVIGKGTNSKNESENHAWNYVKLNNAWYAVDCTWDDPIIVGGFASNRVKYTYFLKGYSTFNKDHYPSGRFTEKGKLFIYPNLSSSDY